MNKEKSLTQVQMLENYRIALANVEKHAEIAEDMAQYGYNATLLEEGKSLCESARLVFDEHIKVKQATFDAKTELNVKLEQLNVAYTLQRKKARIIFRKDKAMLAKLELNGRLAKGYVKRVETMKTFYHTVQSDASIQSKLARLKIENIDIATGLLRLKALETARSAYVIKLGERQESTQTKDNALRLLKDWMIEFFLVAKIAMHDKPQLLEVLGINVKR